MSEALSAQVEVQAPAKLNLFLHVVGRTENGYHNLQSLFTLIDLWDVLRFSVRKDGLIRRCNEIAGIPESEDLVVRAAKLLQAHTGCSLGADIEVLKQIPSGAGLGGGSSDAATTLMTLNQLWGTGLSNEALRALGVQLGADVPFFIFGKTAIATGVGEQLMAFDLSPLYYLVVRPHLSIPTPLIFKDKDLVRNSPILSAKELAQGRILMEQAQHFARNDLEAVALKLFPELAVLIAGLRGEAGVDLRMTGSGSCFFAPFLSLEKAQEARDRVVEWHAHHPSALKIEGLFVVKSK